MDRGCYTLIIRLPKQIKLQGGRLGKACFPKGIYLYTGSAMRGFNARLSHHLRSRKKSHWHIDYLLKSPRARVEKVVIYPTPTREECRLNQKITRLAGSKVLLKGFGASDCSSGCAAHLTYIGRKISLERVAEKIAKLSQSIASALILADSFSAVTRQGRRTVE
jgi:Uri superfamily endonuclease